MYTQEELNRLAAKIHRAKLQVIIHAMGDKAVNVALKAFETFSTEQSLNKRRHRLEQAALLNRPLIERTRKLGVVVSIQPKVVESEFAIWSATEHLGKKRAKMLFPLKTLLKKGVCVAGGSDCPMEPLNPLVGIQSLVARKSFPEECLSIEEALRLYTVNAAYATQEEAGKGSIEEGKLADLTVLAGDPTAIASDRLADVEVEMTIVGGRVAYRKAPT
jgi:predicted amidohydrolase YtcJ